MNAQVTTAVTCGVESVPQKTSTGPHIITLVPTHPTPLSLKGGLEFVQVRRRPIHE